MVIFALVSMVLEAAPPTGFTTAVERVALERTGGPLDARVDPLLRTIVLTGAKVSGRLSSQLCPQQIQRKNHVELRCTTRRLWAVAQEDATGAYLDVRALRGVTWHWEAAGVPLRAWSFTALGIPEKCPGVTEAVQAECLLGEGALFEAQRLYTEALSGPDSHLARMRLGDLALMRDDPEAALAWYGKVASAGPVNRVVTLRACDLTGACLGQKVPQFDGLSGEVLIEATVHVVRQELAVDHDREAVELLAALVEAKEPICTVASAFCQKVLHVVLESNDDDARAIALAVFSSTNVSEGADGVPLAKAAANAAEAAGAPGYAAAVLSSISGRLGEDDDLDTHLQRVTRLYLAAGDFVRAQVVVDYAEHRLSAKARSSSSWRSLQRVLAPKATKPNASKPGKAIAERLPELSEGVEITKELARAAQARAAAQRPNDSGGVKP